MKTIAFYCGSFNPFHIGHQDIVVQAKAMFDTVVVARGVNPAKAHLKEWADPKSIDIIEYKTLTTTFIREYTTAVHQPVLVRGVRSGYDLEYEFAQMRVYQDLWERKQMGGPKLRVVILPCNPAYTHISSSMIRGLATFNSIAANEYVVK